MIGQLICHLSQGKFYELYEKDAEIGHNEFDLKLTDRVKMKMVSVGSAYVWRDY
jgi:DNA mismatch repair protein MSH6